MGTSSRPVGMIFSIIHFFGISLNPSESGADDRLGATIALAQAILKNQRMETARWKTCSSSRLPPIFLPFLSFPRRP